MKRLNVNFATHKYEFAHGRRPSGGAGWAFEVDLSVPIVERLVRRSVELHIINPIDRVGVEVLAEKPATARFWTGSRKYGEAKIAVRRMLEDACYDVPPGSWLSVEVCS